MNKISKFKSTEMWYIPFVIVLTALALVIYFVHIPFSALIVKNILTVANQKEQITRMASFPKLDKTLRTEIYLMDSLVNSRKNTQAAQQKNLIENLYALADSANLKTSKVEIGQSVKSGNHKETPVTILANGTYVSIGTFLEQIENASQPVTIRTISMKESGSTISFHINFDIIE
jgi:Tfp pilus assembly protein PilO